MFFDADVEDIEDRTEEADYPPSEVDEYEDSSSEEEEPDAGQAASASASTAAAVPDVHPFTGECRLLVTIEPTPVAYFLHLVDEPFLASICEHTNRHAAAAASPGEGFTPLHLAELKVFLGIALHARRGVDGLFDESMRFAPRFHRLFAKSMTKDRFLEILRLLHFSPNPVEPTELAALGNLIEHFNGKMASTYSPGRELCVYNSVVIWRGLAACRERIARYCDGRHGVALDALCEPSGLTLRLRASAQALELERAGSALRTRVLDDLTHGLLDRGHALYLDPFYCSATAARRLLARGTHCTGLLGGVHRARREHGVLVAPWRAGGLSYVTTEFGSGTERARARGGTKTPVAVAAYMRATRRDRRVEELPQAPGATLRLRWHKQVFLLALHVLARNACTLYRRYSGDSVSFARFLAEVSLALLPLGLADLSDDDDDRLDHTDDSRHL